MKLLFRSLIKLDELTPSNAKNRKLTNNLNPKDKPNDRSTKIKNPLHKRLIIINTIVNPIAFAIENDLVASFTEFILKSGRLLGNPA